MAWAPNQKLQGGKYTIEKKLGVGGFGITYLAKDKPGNLVVVKTLNESFQFRYDFAKFQSDFLNEALRLAKCSHPHIVQIKEVLQEGDLWCMVMEYIQGEDLAHRVWNQGVLPELEALRYIQQVGEALSVVHQHGLLHRDVKPLNIMLRQQTSEAVLIDFGIAREFIPNLTQTHTQALSEGFAPIEQYDWRAKRGAYTDIYALAATLYTLLTAQVPVSSPVRAFGMSLATPKQLNSSISDRTNRAIIKGMELKPQLRPQSVSEWLALLGDTPNYLPDDYSNLQYLLGINQWKEADRLTATIILTISGRERWLRVEDIEKFPASELHAIDSLWQAYSNGRFGLSVQKRIWQSCGGSACADWSTWCKFGEQVGWRMNGTWLSYSSLIFTEKAPEGQFPALVVSDNFALRHQESMASLLSRVDF